MKGITITDSDERGILSVSLNDLLHLLQPAISDSAWSCDDVEATGKTAEELYRLCDSRTQLDSETLMRLAAGLDQIIDGSFRAFRPRQSQPWLIIRAVDSAAYDVETNDVRLLERLRGKFRRAVDIPQ